MSLPKEKTKVPEIILLSYFRLLQDYLHASQIVIPLVIGFCISILLLALILLLVT